MSQIEDRISVWNDRCIREDVRFGQLLTVYVSAHKKKGATVPDPWQWFGHRRPKRELTEAEWIENAQRWAKG